MGKAEKDVNKVQKFLKFCMSLFRDLENTKKGDILNLEFGGRRYAIVSMDDRRKTDDDEVNSFEDFVA